MKKICFLLILLIPGLLSAQVGIRAGMNFANVTKVSDINNSATSGFHVGLVLAPPSKGIMSSQTELLFSRQGYDYKTGTNTGEVNLDYIMMPQLMSINITRFVSILIGGHMAFLINAKVDSTTNGSGTGYPGSELMDIYNKFDYGYGGGLEVHPVSGLLIGARINISLGNLYQTPEPGQPIPSFVPAVDVKNNLFQIYAGWKFGGGTSKKEKKDSGQ